MYIRCVYNSRQRITGIFTKKSKYYQSFILSVYKYLLFSLAYTGTIQKLRANISGDEKVHKNLSKKFIEIHLLTILKSFFRNL